jgi:hypothetical protein
LDKWHFLATSSMKLLSMCIVLHGLSPTNILLNVVHAFYNCDLSIWLTIDCHKNLLQVVQEIRIKHSFHSGIDFVFLHMISQYPTLTL